MGSERSAGLPILSSWGRFARYGHFLRLSPALSCAALLRRGAALLAGTFSLVRGVSTSFGGKLRPALCILDGFYVAMVWKEALSPPDVVLLLLLSLTDVILPCGVGDC